MIGALNGTLNGAFVLVTNNRNGLSSLLRLIVAPQ